MIEVSTKSGPAHSAYWHWSPRMVHPHPISFRAIRIGILLGGTLAFLNPHVHYVTKSWSIGWGSLPGGVVFALFLLVACNDLLVRLSPNRAFNRRELLLAYAATIIAYPIVRMYLPYLFGMLSHAVYRASPENDWGNLILTHIPSWSLLADPHAVDWFWEGLPQGQAIPWHAWATPMLAWGSFTLALMGSVFCLAALMRREWIETQRLTFPLVEVPLAVVGDQQRPTLRRSIFANRVFWLCFAVPAAVSLLQWLGRLAPAVPNPSLDYFIGGTFAGMGLPWNVLSGTRIRVYFSIIGIAALVPGEVSLSLWFFYLLSRTVLVALASFGLTGPSGTAGVSFNPTIFLQFTEVGGFLVLALAALWQSRATLRAAVRGLLPGAPAAADPYAPLSPRAALLGFLLLNTFLIWWALRAGMSWWSFSALMVLYYLAMITCSRMVAAAGVMRADASVWPFPREVLLRSLGAASIGPPSLTVMAFISVAYMLDIQDSAMPQVMNSFKLLHLERIRAARFPLAAAAVVVAVLVLAIIALLLVIYRHGATYLDCWPITGAAICGFRQLDASLHSPELADNWLRGAMAGGAAFTLLLIWLSTHFVWWPLSPIGFVFGSSFFANYAIWFNALVGWSLATLVRRYGGLKLYRTFYPGFLGLVLGEFLSRSGLAIISLLFGLRVGDQFLLG